jgi:hypothetical protein
VQVTARPSPVRVATWNLWWRFGPWQRRRDAIAIGTARRWSEAAVLRRTQHGGNPGVDTSRHRTGLDGIGPAPEQPRWSWTGLG